jgi:serine-type D-Ala-D-Ala carboxypeptidase/endopeptidase
MFSNYFLKKLPLLFTIGIFLITIVSSPTISSALGSPSAANSSTNPVSNFSSSSSSSTSSAAQKEKNNPTSTFKITNQIKGLINDLVDKNKTNAAIAIGFVDPNGTQFYGHGKLSNASNATVDQNTIFAIGSNTKVFTTILLSDMVNKGLIKLDDPIEKYLPSNVTVPSFKGHKITIEDLATHTSGLPEWPANYCPVFNPTKGQQPINDTIQNRISEINCTKNYTLDQLYKGLSNTTLSREPGSKFEYSTFGSALLGHILTLKSNMSSFDELLKHNILNVLGMNDTSISPSDSQKSRLAMGHFNGQELPYWNLTVFAPGGAIHSTVGDMLKFLSANMGLIKTKLDNAMQESHLIRHSTGFVLPNNLQASSNTNNIGVYVGLGWLITTNYGHEIVWHNGATVSGYNAYMAFNPTTERGIVILCSVALENIKINDISFNQKYKLNSLIWNLLNE